MAALSRRTVMLLVLFMVLFLSLQRVLGERDGDRRRVGEGAGAVRHLASPVRRVADVLIGRNSRSRPCRARTRGRTDVDDRVVARLDDPLPRVGETTRATARRHG